MDNKKDLIIQAVARAKLKFSQTVFDSFDESVQNKIIETELSFIEKELENELMRERLSSLELHRERVRKTVEWMREVDKSKEEPKFMTTVSYERPKRQVGVPQEFDKSCEFSNIESKPVSLVGNRVISFRRETLDSFADEMMAMLNIAIEYEKSHAHYRSHMAYACLHIWVAGQRRLGTRAIGIGRKNMKADLDYLYDVEFMNMINEIEQAQHFYEVVFESDSPCHVHFYFKVQYYPEPGCVLNWGNDLKSVEHLKLFDLFTANDPDNCVLQCSRRVWPVDLDSLDDRCHNEATEDCIAKLISRAEGNVVILTPRAYVRYIAAIHTYGDLAIDPLSPIKTLSVIDPDYIYLLHWKEHIGVMENMKTEIPHALYTKFRPLQKFPKCKKLTVCFDIECYFDPHSETAHVPYLCCACFVYDDEPGNVMEFEGRDCVAQMVEWSAEIADDYGHDNVELIAHNGGGYDFHYILSSMHNPSAVYDILIRNNHFISFKFCCGDVVFSVKDSLNFLLCSLSTAAKAFLADNSGKVMLNKTDFPHHEVRAAEDLQRTFQEWTKVEQNIHVNVEKERMLISVDHVIKYKQVCDNCRTLSTESCVHGESKRLIDWAREYCCNDVIVLAMVWVKFKQTALSIFNCHIVDQTMTLAGLSFRLFEAHLPAGVKLFHPAKQDFDNMRSALIGGRCISMNGLWHDVLSLDVKSLYPAAMAFYDQPYGRYYKVKQENNTNLGIYYCKVTSSTFACESSNREKHGFFPIKTNNGDVSYKVTNNTNCFEGWYTSVDIEIGRSEGHKITPIPFNNYGHVGYCWHSRGKIFKDYICNVLYRLKLEYEQAGNNEKRQVIKIIMNSLWGKFAQKWMDTKYDIVREEDADLTKECFKIWDTNHMLSKTHENKSNASKPVQNGVFTLSWARYHMKLLWDAITTPDAECLYSDTDSIMIQSEYICSNKKIMIDGKSMSVLGSEMGQLECEHHFNDLVCVGKKQYMGKYYDSERREHERKFGAPLAKYKFRFKGVPQYCIRPEMYTHLLKDPSHKVQIDFLKFKREWGAVHGYIESKVVTAT